MYQSECNDVIVLVDNIIKSALRCNASDIHIEPERKKLRIRFRIDGILSDYNDTDHALVSQILSRIKIMAHIDVAEKRVPQDGKFQFHFNDSVVDCRVSTFPALHGETIVIRILNKNSYGIALDDLGFEAEDLDVFKGLLVRSQGFILVAGPTGSGKTTTLYAALSTLNSDQTNIITLEDPVEYAIAGITQGQINPAAGFTFEKGMRALLRQDPDVVMLGEIRDKQTAQIAIEASLTGHLVFSTVHANNSSSVIMRLIEMKVEPFLINASLSGVLAQRLARKICQSCKISYPVTPQDRAVLDLYGGSACTLLYAGQGCDACHNQGYKGRVGIFELLTVTDQLCALMVQHPSYKSIEQQAKKDGMRTLMQNGMQKVQQGVITLQELLRVVL